MPGSEGTPPPVATRTQAGNMLCDANVISKQPMCVSRAFGYGRCNVAIFDADTNQGMCEGENRRRLRPRLFQSVVERNLLFAGM